MPDVAFDHLHLRSPDPEATADWYVRMLGAVVVGRLGGARPRIDLRLGGATVYVGSVAPEGVTGPAPVPPYRGLEHIGLRVTGIAAVVRKLRDRGVTITLDVTEARPGTRIAFLRGPEDVSIELLEVAADQPGVALGSASSAPP